MSLTAKKSPSVTLRRLAPGPMPYEQIEKLKYWVGRGDSGGSHDRCILALIARIERLRAALKEARCPDEDCDNGAVPVGPDPSPSEEEE